MSDHETRPVPEPFLSWGWGPWHTIAWDVDRDVFDVCRNVKGVRIIEEKTVHCYEDDDPDAVEERLRTAGANPTQRREITWEPWRLPPIEFRINPLLKE
jgi:hypothetical protein